MHLYIVQDRRNYQDCGRNWHHDKECCIYYYHWHCICKFHRWLKNQSLVLILSMQTIITAVVYVTTVQGVETDTTSLDSTSTLSTVFVTEVPAAATATSSVTYFSPVDVAVTTTVPTTPATTVTVPAATTTVTTDVAYSLVFGPQDGCAYVLEAYVFYFA